MPAASRLRRCGRA